MSTAFSTPHNRITTLILFAVCGLSTFVSVIVGIDDNPPGALLALLAGIAFVLAFVHPWRTAKKFLFLLLASVFGIVLFIIINIISDSIVQNPDTSAGLRNLIDGPVNEALSVVFTMICVATFLIGVVGSVAMFIRSRHSVK
jgi:energy-coupling factor transporter transmembrane protein EcfT